MKIIAWLRSPTATLCVLCAALVAQLPHAADVFRIIVSGTGWPAVAHGYAYAIALELAVLLFVVQRRNVESYIFAGVSVLVNLSYYSLHGINLLTIAALPAWLVSIALPAAIARYSHLLVETPQPQAQPITTEVTDAAAKTTTSGRGSIQTSDRSLTADSGQAFGPGSQNENTEIAQSTPATPAKKVQRKAAPVARKAKRGTKPTPEQRRAQIASSGMDDAGEIAAQFGVSVRTAQADLNAIRQATTQTNGVHA